jgi:hypothetical protein
MRKASTFKVIKIWFSYRIPIGSRRILHFPRSSDYRIQLSEIVGSDIRQLPVGFRFQGIRQLPTGSCRKLSDYLVFPVGSDGIRAWDSSSWERKKISYFDITELLPSTTRTCSQKLINCRQTHTCKRC